MKNLIWKRDDLSGLDYLAKESDQNDTAVILLHGYGADCTDLAPLSGAIVESQKYDWFFPNGPEEVAIGPHMSGRAWFPIDMQKLQLAQMTGQFEHYLAASIPSGFLEACSKVESLVSVLKERYSKIILGGFSQGSMISAQVALQKPAWLEGLILLSSTFVSESSWRDLVSQDLKFPILQSHGTFDAVLPFNAALRLSEFLKEHTSHYQFVSFQGGHEIPNAVLEAMGKMMMQVRRGERAP